MDMISGVILLNKEAGHTSRKEVSTVAKKLGEKKAGHIGTLDPFATGLLIVLLGRATKISPFLEGFDKRYIATLKLGIATDSGDTDGKVVVTNAVPKLTEEQIRDVLTSFLGESSQIPPMFSALKKDGKPLYRYAREGLEIERSARAINIKDIKLLSFKNDEIVFSVLVSKGTYIRTLGEDIAKKLGTCGHLIKLERQSIGPFTLSEAVSAEDTGEKDIKSIDEILSFMPSLVVDADDSFKALNGARLNIGSNEDKLLIKDSGGIIAVYQRDEDGIYSCLRGLR